MRSWRWNRLTPGTSLEDLQFCLLQSCRVEGGISVSRKLFLLLQKVQSGGYQGSEWRRCSPIHPGARGVPSSARSGRNIIRCKDAECQVSESRPTQAAVLFKQSLCAAKGNLPFDSVCVFAHIRQQISADFEGGVDGEGGGGRWP